GQEHIHEFCEQGHCRCEKGIWSAALVHTAQIAFFILLITFGLNLILFWAGEEALESMILNNPAAGPILAGIVGLLPNCAGSVVITQLYLKGVIGIGAAMAGLLTGSGIGLLVLFRVNHNRRENLKLLGLLYSIGVLAGIVIEWIL
ncbi:MAG: arsenic efflux protein, partial [Acetatifactor sp.]|nr:arsenic efflux protein [Acetatifactor sp.]